MLIAFAKSQGADEAVLRFVDESYRVGWNLQPTLQYHVKRNYAGIFYSHLKVSGEVEAAQALALFAGYSIPFTLRASLGRSTVDSNLHNAGLVVGRVFPLKNPALSLKTEASFARTFGSQTYLRRPNGQEVPVLSQYADNELRQYYRDYGYLPSLNLIFAYRFPAKD
ncbi:hypothetical protein LJY25_19145 [Hymenobacter sp. BT175]|uniref:hypothetical protein n=1 Tax=Hymenobacter translucens TaxID=2886507 RepID=UPI001D0F099B|nr:hypothetical protein [Hymenobacter translucens]MCC2548572.1 hypothetical protein [Hymenobacter translucens]